MKQPDKKRDVVGELMTVSEFAEMVQRIGERIKQGQSFTEASIPEIQEKRP